MNSNERHTDWIDGLKQGSEDDAAQLWNAYFSRLITAIERRLGSTPNRKVDPEDVAVSVFESLCAGAREGRFEQLSDRVDLLQLLLRIAQRKTVDHLRHANREKRGGGNLRGESALGDGAAAFAQIGLAAPTPAQLAEAEDQVRHLLDELPDESFRNIAKLRLAGFRNGEIAKELDVPLRSVERKLSIIRSQWTRHVNDEED